MNISIIAACTPTLYHVISGFSAGLVDLHIPENMELSTQNRSKHTQSKSSFSNTRSGRFRGSTQKTEDKSSRPLHSPFRTQDDPWVYGHQTQVRARSEDARSTESTTHLTRADSQGVMKTVDVWVDVETREDGDSR
ncbi:hypothetical protein PHISCL_01923 [Aspergillus sclerotialis]|uniref:Uncharacterized protein n=1 Tax=Aspergillus sclerotialis TaxID=2070753 RepID=A0A3A3A6Y2_9EURO|nr:hypothetical protein PHISCL_01923 [Aspergillus sclerotialis]